MTARPHSGNFEWDNKYFELRGEIEDLLLVQDNERMSPCGDWAMLLKDAPAGLYRFVSSKDLKYCLKTEDEKIYCIEHFNDNSSYPGSLFTENAPGLHMEVISIEINTVNDTPIYIAGNKLTFTEHGIKVGCEFISKNKIEEIYKEAKKLWGE